MIKLDEQDFLIIG